MTSRGVITIFQWSNVEGRAPADRTMAALDLPAGCRRCGAACDDESALLTSGGATLWRERFERGGQ